MNESDYVCAECRAPIDPAATVCPHCGYDPAGKIRREAAARILVGTILCLTIIGGVIGLPLLYSGVKHNRRAEGVVPATEGTDREHTVTPS